MIENFPETIASLTKRLEMLQDKHESLDFWAAKTVAKMLSELDTSVSTLRKDGGETYTDLTKRLNNHIAAISESIERIEQRLDGLAQTIAEVATDAESLAERLDALEGNEPSLDDLRKQLDGVVAVMQAHKDHLERHKERQNKHEERLDVLEAAYQDHVKRLHEARESHIQTWDPDDLFVRRIDLDAHGREGWGSRDGVWEIKPSFSKHTPWDLFGPSGLFVAFATLKAAAQYVKDNSLVWEEDRIWSRGDHKAWKTSGNFEKVLYSAPMADWGAENIQMILVGARNDPTWSQRKFPDTTEGRAEAHRYLQGLASTKYLPPIPENNS